MKKKLFILIILIICICGTNMKTAEATDYCYSYFYYHYNSWGGSSVTISITGFLPNHPTEIVFPDTIEGFPVTSISDSVFSSSECSDITSVYISSNIKYIGGLTSKGLESIHVDENNPKYDSRNNCNAVIETSTNTLVKGCMNTIIPNTVTSIGNYAFRNCSGLTSIEIPNSVTSIGAHAFRNCSGLTSIEIPNSVTSIGAYAFQYCFGLTSIEIPNSVTSIGDYAFDTCSGLTSIEIPNSVTSIGNYAFRYCRGLTSIEIPNSVTEIGEEAFSNCSKLQNIVIPNSITSMGKKVLFGCNKLTEITMPMEKKLEYMFYNYVPDSLKTVHVIGETICDSAFYECTQLKEIEISSTVTSIGESAFYGCTGLTSIEIPERITSIGNDAFNNVNNEAVKFIAPSGSYNFTYAYSNRAYNNRYRILTDGNIDFYYSNGTLTIYSVGDTCDYISATDVLWDSFKDNITKVVVKANTTYLGQYLFRSLTNLTDVVIENKDLTFGYKVFADNLTLNCESPLGGSTESYLRQNNSYTLTKMNNPNSLIAPTVKTYSNTSIELNSVDGYEYSIDGTTFQDSAVFTGLTANTSYTLYQRIKENSTYKESSISTSVTQTTLALPVDPIIEESSSVTITLKPIEGYEYSIGGVNFQDSNVLEIIEYDVDLNIYQRIKETSKHSCSINSNSVTKKIEANSPEFSSVQVDSITLVQNDNYQYSLGGEVWQDSNVFTEFNRDEVLNFYQRIKGLGENVVSKKSSSISAIVISDPVLQSATTEKIIVVPHEGYEYSVDGTTWQDSNEFTDFPPSNFIVSQRIKDNTINAIYVSDGKTTADYSKFAPVIHVTNVGADSVTVTAITGCEYSMDQITWQDSNTFTGLDFTEEYTFYGRMKDVEDALVSSVNENEITGISISSNPDKTSYIKEYNDFEIPGLKIKISYEYGEKIIDATTDMITGFDNSNIGTNTIKVTYEGFETTFNVDIVDKSLDHISVTTKPTKLEYVEGKDFESAGMIVTAYYDNETSEVVSDYTVTGYESTPGTQNVVVSYGGKTDTFEVTVKVKSLDHISVTTKPTKLEYLEGKDFESTGMVVTAYYDNDTYEAVTNYEVSGYDSSIGTKTITVTYGGKTDTFEVTVKDKSLDYITVTTKPTKLVYLVGKPFEESGMIVTAYYDNDTSEVVTNYTVSGYESTVGTKTITVTYSGKTDSFEVTVNDKSIDHITVTTKPTKLEYLEGKPFESDDMVVTAYYDNDTNEVVTNYDISCDTNTIGTVPVTITYLEKTDTFNITVIAKTLTEIVMDRLPNKVGYRLDKDLFNPVGGIVKLVFDNDTTENVDLTSEMVSGFDNSSLGEKTITVTYLDKITTFVINIVEYIKGDMNNDEAVTDQDAIYLLYHTLFPDKYPIDQDGDMNNDGEVTDQDAIYLLYHTLFPDKYPIEF